MRLAWGGKDEGTALTVFESSHFGEPGDPFLLEYIRQQVSSARMMQTFEQFGNISVKTHFIWQLKLTTIILTFLFMWPRKVMVGLEFDTCLIVSEADMFLKRKVFLIQDSGIVPLHKK